MQDRRTRLTEICTELSELQEQLIYAEKVLHFVLDRRRGDIVHSRSIRIEPFLQTLRYIEERYAGIYEELSNFDMNHDGAAEAEVSEDVKPAMDLYKEGEKRLRELLKKEIALHVKQARDSAFFQQIQPQLEIDQAKILKEIYQLEESVNQMGKISDLILAREGEEILKTKSINLEYTLSELTTSRKKHLQIDDLLSQLDEVKDIVEIHPELSFSNIHKKFEEGDKSAFFLHQKTGALLLRVGGSVSRIKQKYEEDLQFIKTNQSLDEQKAAEINRGHLNLTPSLKKRRFSGDRNNLFNNLDSSARKNARLETEENQAYSKNAARS